MQQFSITGRVLTPEGILPRGTIKTSGGRIASIEPGEPASPSSFDFGDMLIAPGFVDIHVHGGNGNDFMSGDPSEIKRALAFHAKHGTTSMLPTTVTASGERISNALIAIQKVVNQKKESDYEATHGAEILGVHLEGPFIHPNMAGGQDSSQIRSPDLAEYQKWESLASIKLVTLAPELPEAETLIRYISTRGVRVSAGHTNATYEDILQAMGWGVSQLTHFFNAMSKLNHRHPGVVGAGMLIPNLVLELISDGIHVHPEMLRLMCKLKEPDQLVLITDASVLCGLQDGSYLRQGKEIIVKKGTIRLQDGTLKGSNLTMDVAVKNMIGLGIPLEQVWHMASVNPARLLGYGKSKGRIQLGMDADLVVMDETYSVVMTMINGKVAYGNEKTSGS